MTPQWKCAPLTIAVLLLFALPLSNATVTNDAWPSARGDERCQASIAYEGPGNIEEWHYMHRTGRRYKSGLAVWASPALAIVAGRPTAFIGGYGQTMNAMDLLDKKVLWRKTANAEIPDAPAVGQVDGLDIVFWASNDRTLYAQSALNGRVIWTKELAEASSSQGEAMATSPALLGGRVHAAIFVHDKSLRSGMSRSWLFRIDARSGELLWKTELVPGPVNSPTMFERNGKQFAAVCSRRGLVILQEVSDSGARRVWEYQMPHEVLGSAAVAEIDGRTLLYVGSKYGNIVALDAARGRPAWSRMAASWFDNTPCVGMVKDRPALFAGSHDYNLYAFDAATGVDLWSRPLGGEVYSAPCYWQSGGSRRVAAAALDNHLYVIDADDGSVLTSYFTGSPIWDKLNKGENLWGSPAVVSAPSGATLVHGSFSDVVYVLPVDSPCSIQAMARSGDSLWLTVLWVGLGFAFVLLPIMLWTPEASHKT